MVRLSKCKKCNRQLSSFRTTSMFGIHGRKFQCCGIQYYKCNHFTCSHKQKKKLFYEFPSNLNEHIGKYHLNRPTDKNTSVSFLEIGKKNNLSTSYDKNSSLGKYYLNYCSADYDFPPQQQSNAIKNIITTACANKTGVFTLSQSICQSSFTIFFPSLKSHSLQMMQSSNI